MIDTIVIRNHDINVIKYPRRAYKSSQSLKEGYFKWFFFDGLVGGVEDVWDDVSESLSTKGDLSFSNVFVFSDVFIRNSCVLVNASVSSFRSELEGFETPFLEIFVFNVLGTERVFVREGAWELTNFGPDGVSKGLYVEIMLILNIKLTSLIDSLNS
jgi:hypothetical protein